MHIISGDLWAGAEAQAYELLCQQQQHCRVAAILLNDGLLCTKLKQSGIEVLVENESSNSTLQLIVKITKHLRALNPDVVHTHRNKENLIGSIANKLSGNALCVRTIHGHNEHAEGFKQKTLASLDNFVGRHLQDRIISVSEELERSLSQLFSAEKVAIIRNGVDVERLRENALKSIDNIDDSKINIGLVGRLVPVKRPDIFIAIARKTHNLKIDKFHFHIIGDGPLLPDVQKAIHNEHLGSVVTIHGHRSDVPSTIKSLDAIVLCSDHEGTPMVALESIALGTQLIVHNVSGLASLANDFPEIIRIEDNHEGEYLSALESIKKEKIDYQVSKISSSENADAVLRTYLEGLKEKRAHD